mgnify:CR=1 FL=1
MIFKENSIISNGNRVLLKIYHSQVSAGRRVFREHHHTAFEIALFLSGSGAYTVQNKKYHFRKNDIFLFSTNEIHCITEIEPFAPLDILNVHFEPRFIWAKEDGISNVGLLRVFFDRNQNFENRLARENPATDRIRGLLLAIEDEFSQKRPEYENMVKTFLLQLLIEIIRDFDYVGSGKNYSGQNEKLQNLSRNRRHGESQQSLLQQSIQKIQRSFSLGVHYHPPGGASRGIAQDNRPHETGNRHQVRL